MKLYYALLAPIAILWFGVVSPSVAEPQLPSPQSTPMPQRLIDFNTISVRGPIHLQLEQPVDGGQNYFQIPEGQHSPVSVSVKNGALYLQANDAAQLTTAIVGVGKLNQLIVDGDASVSAKHFTSSSLSIDANTSGNIELLGMVTLEHLLSSGNGSIHIEWVDSPRLRIDGSGKSQIQLAGVADAVEMRLRDNSQFQGRYLRINQIFVQTKDFSSARLLVNDSLRAFAYDHSNIYYYKKPAELTEFTSGSGNILQLGWGQ